VARLWALPQRLQAGSVVEVSIKRLYEKQCHPQNIEDDGYNSQNDGVGWHSKYTPSDAPFLHWKIICQEGPDLGQNGGEQEGPIYR